MGFTGWLGVLKKLYCVYIDSVWYITELLTLWYSRSNAISICSRGMHDGHIEIFTGAYICRVRYTS